MVLPDGPRDIEAMYVLPSEQIFFVTKGRNHPVTIYRYPPPLRSEDVVTLVEVQRLTTGPVGRPRMVTGASATLDGGTVVLTSESAPGIRPSLTFLNCNLNPTAIDQPELK